MVSHRAYFIMFLANNRGNFSDSLMLGDMESVNMERNICLTRSFLPKQMDGCSEHLSENQNSCILSALIAWTVQ